MCLFSHNDFATFQFSGGREKNNKISNNKKGELFICNLLLFRFLLHCYEVAGL